MNIADVKRNAFAMPLTSPAFPPGPYRFTNREFMIVTYRTDMDALRAVVPDPPTSSSAAEALFLIAQRTAAQGEPLRALAVLEADERYQKDHPDVDFALRRSRLTLGDAYAAAGRRDDARRTLKAAYEDFAAHDTEASPARMAATERWARQLLDDGQADEARRLFQSVVQADAGRHLAYAALARAGWALAELRLNHPAAALPLASEARADWQRVTGLSDVRFEPRIRRAQARALLASGDFAAAKSAAATALAESRQYDAPGAASIAEAAELVRLAQAGLSRH